MNIMFLSQKEIIDYINENNNKKMKIPEFLDTILKNHIQDFHKTFALEKALQNLTLKFIK
mgnify:CR=1 FL=1